MGTATKNDRVGGSSAVKECRAQLTLPHRTISITGSSQEQVINDINKLLESTSKATFKQHDENTSFIYHRDYLNSEEPIGFLMVHEVPESLSANWTAEQRLGAAAGA